MRKKQETNKARAERHNISESYLYRLRREGVDIENEDELTAAITPQVQTSDIARLNKAKADKAEADARSAKVKADAEEGKYVSIEEAIGDAIQTGLIEQQAWLKMPDELIPMLTGLESGAMLKVAKRYARDKLHENGEAYEAINSFSIRTPPEKRTNATAGNATKRVGGKKRPPAK